MIKHNEWDSKFILSIYTRGRTIENALIQEICNMFGKKFITDVRVSYIFCCTKDSKSLKELLTVIALLVDDVDLAIINFKEYQDQALTIFEGYLENHNLFGFGEMFNPFYIDSN